ncbi:transmembrane 115 [Micractinium conductrix]|uniref:Transmembrane 115 n=1 Tax=Micractinium conductrix TaxID=554055 RepID=A0A2P6V1F5_9CHLO|nr:transmembrane 115 [Micractinium conductrix]|eukprot:PSC67919.1 transmembrane 115 [Micractinium conductrix]
MRRCSALLAAAAMFLAAQMAAGQNTVGKCLAAYPQCTKCTKSGATFQCSTCDSTSKLVPTRGYYDRNTGRLIKKPYCDGYCMYLKRFGNLLENNSNPCLGCTGAAGCASCAKGSFRTPDNYGQFKYGLSTLPMMCASCGYCQDGKCGPAGCTACDTQSVVSTSMYVANANAKSPTDPKVCISDLCDDYGDPESVFDMPINNNLWSYAPHCKQTGSKRSCSKLKGCTACFPGSYLVKHPLVPGAAYCQRCEGCPAGRCSATGCSSCTIAGLTKRVAVPGRLNAAGKQVYACRGAAQPVAFAGRGASASLPDTALWPVSEFQGCGPNAGEYKIDWSSNSGDASELSISSWYDNDETSISFRPINTLRIKFSLTTNTRVGITLEYTDAVTKAAVRHTLLHALPTAQDRVCIVFNNYVATRDSEKAMAAQLTFENKSKKRVLLHFSGDERSLTPRLDFENGLPFGGGAVTVKTRAGADIASPTLGPAKVKWTNTENVFILPSEQEWDDFKKPVGAVASAAMASAVAGLGDFSLLGKGLAAALVAGSAACQMKSLGPALKSIFGLVAARAIPRPFVLLTCAFLQDSFFTAVAYAALLLFLTRIVEPIHGTRELIKFLVFTVVLTSFFTVALVTVIYYVTTTKGKSGADHAGDMLFRPMGGFEAAMAALMVGVKQLIPDNEVALLGGALKFRAKHLPGIYGVAMVAGSLLLGCALRVISFTFCGTYLAWAYLRFVQARNGVRGDLSDEFRLASFFPGVLQQPVDRAAGACTRLTGLGKAAGSAQHQVAWNYGMAGGATLLGSDAGDAARRRERGAKALEERLGMAKAATAKAAAAPAAPAALAAGPAGNAAAADQAEADVESAAGGDA